MAQRASNGEFAAHKLESRIARWQPALELGIFHGIQDLAEFRPGRMTRGNQIIAGDERYWAHLFRGNLRQLLTDQVICAQDTMAGQAVGTMQG